MTRVHTTKGPLAIELLEVRDIVTVEGTSRVVATEWRMKGDDEIVRRDVWVNALMPLEVSVTQGGFNGQ